jgi:hypothetical protein
MPISAQHEIAPKRADALGRPGFDRLRRNPGLSRLLAFCAEIGIQVVRKMQDE